MNLTEFAAHVGRSKQAVAKSAARGEFADAVKWTESVEGQRRATIADLDRAVLLWKSRHRAPALAKATSQPKPGRKEEAPRREKQKSTPRTISAPPPKPASESVPSSSSDPLGDLALSRLEFERFKAKRERLEYEKESGKLISVEDAMRILGKQIQEAKSAVMALGKHARGRLPHLTVDDVVVIEDLCREALEGLAAGVLAEDPSKDAA